MGKKGNEWDGEIYPLADERDWGFYFNGKQMEERNQAQNGIFLEGVSGDFQRKEDSSSDCDSPRG